MAPLSLLKAKPLPGEGFPAQLAIRPQATRDMHTTKGCDERPPHLGTTTPYGKAPEPYTRFNIDSQSLRLRGFLNPMWIPFATDHTTDR